MKIVHFVSSLKIGGAEKLVCNLASYQKKIGYDVAIISFGPHDDLFALELKKSNINVHFIKGSFFTRNKKIIEICSDKDILHFHSSPVIRSLCFLLPLFFFKKTIYTIHGETNPSLVFFKLAHLFSRPFLDEVTAVSKSARKAARLRFNWSPKKIKLIGNGVILKPKVRSKSSGDSVFRLGVVARLIELKNISLIFKALKDFSHASKRNIILEVFGDGPLLEQLRIEAKSTGIATIFHGFQTDEDIIYSSIDVLLITSNTEGLPMSLIEAMANGVPVISTRVGAIPDIIEDKFSGLLIDVNNQTQLGNAINYLIDNKNEVIKFTNNSQEIIKNNYSIEVIAKEYALLY